jgi:hypothetical protein
MTCRRVRAVQVVAIQIHSWGPIAPDAQLRVRCSNAVSRCDPMKYARRTKGVPGSHLL